MRKSNFGDLLKRWYLCKDRNSKREWEPEALDQIFTPYLFINFEAASKRAITKAEQKLFFGIGPKERAYIWSIILEIGFEKKLVLPFIDPAIRTLMSRLFDLKTITFYESCSGHPFYESIPEYNIPKRINTAPMGYISGLVFQDGKLGTEFLFSLMTSSPD